MYILITGGAGFLGARLAARLLERGILAGPTGNPQPIARVRLVDTTPPQAPKDPRVETVVADLTDAAVARNILRGEVDVVFHLAAVVSGQAEADFDLGMRVNLEASRHLLDACRATGRCPRVIFTSSVAVYGGPLPSMVGDDTALTPRSSYGVQKAIGELLLSDYTRKGFVDGRILRLPTIAVRPGAPNKAASGFVSGIIREPLVGVPAVCPVPGDTPIWVLSPDRAIDALIRGAELLTEELGARRAVNLPGLSTTPAEMQAALARVAGDAAAARVRIEPDPAVTAIVATWPGRWDTSRAESLGFRGDADFDAVIRAHVEFMARTA